MGMLGYLTRGNSTPSGKTRIFFCCHPEDYELFFNEISGDCSLRYAFYNLKDPYPNDHHYEPAVYIDDNNAELCPFVGEYSVKYNNFYYQFMRKQQ